MKHDLYKELTKKLTTNHACYVLITCDRPSEDGKMTVDMSYEGDEALVSYLIDGAQTMIDEIIEEDVTESDDYLRIVK